MASAATTTEQPAAPGASGPTPAGRPRRALLIAVSIAVAVLLVGLAVLRQFGGAEPVPGPESGSSTGTETTAGLPATRLEVPSLGIVAAISPITMSPRRVLEPPANVQAVGWWDRSAPYGSDIGRTVLAGHTVHSGGGALGQLPRLREGGLMRVVTPAGSYEYRTVSVIVRSKAWVRQNGVDVFRQPGGDGSLVVVTCTDWDGKDHRSNVIAIAEPVRPDPVSDDPVSAESGSAETA
jgi:LPXTG-site transpeptidase (sortase) family protein